VPAPNPGLVQKNLFKQGNGKKRVPLKHFESCNRKITFRQMLCQWPTRVNYTRCQLTKL